MINYKFLGILQSVDAFFPTGAFTQSFGLEDYVLSGSIHDDASLESFLTGYISLLPYGDLGLCSLAFSNYSDIETLCRIDQIGSAMKDAKEIREATWRMGSRFIKLHKTMEDIDEYLTQYVKAIDEGHANGLHPIALGILGAQKQVSQIELLMLYAYSCCSAMVNNAVKLVPLSQMSGQRILYQLGEAIGQAVEQACHITEADLGISGCAYCLHCMNHERLYSRQYMS